MCQCLGGKLNLIRFYLFIRESLVCGQNFVFFKLKRKRDVILGYLTELNWIGNQDNLIVKILIRKLEKGDSQLNE